MSHEHLRVDVDGQVATLTIDRPARRNAIDGPLWDAIGAAATALGQSLPRALIVQGAGEHFCAGMDLSPDNALLQTVAGAVMSGDEAGCRRVIEGLKANLNAIAYLGCPVIAAIEGACLGGGLELALTADIRVGAASSKYSLPETRWGMVPDVGGTVRLTRLVGRGRASDLILTGRTIDATEALSWGLITHLVDDGEALNAARALAAKICANSPTATSRALAVARTVDELDDDAAFEAETRAGASALVSQEVLEGMAAFAQRRAPRWNQ